MIDPLTLMLHPQPLYTVSKTTYRYNRIRSPREMYWARNLAYRNVLRDASWRLKNTYRKRWGA